MSFIETITIPRIVSEEYMLLEIEMEEENKNEIYALYDKVKIKDHYYYLYQHFDLNNIDIIDIFKAVKKQYGDSLFYIVEKDEEDNFTFVVGNTIELNENTFSKISLSYADLKNILIINSLLIDNFNYTKSVLFFINLNDKEKETINELFDGNKTNLIEGDIKKVSKFIFPGKNIYLKYRYLLLAIILNIFIYFGFSFYIQDKKNNIHQVEENIIHKYNRDRYKLKRENKKLKKEKKVYLIPSRIEIFQKKGKK